MVALPEGVVGSRTVWGRGGGNQVTAPAGNWTGLVGVAATAGYTSPTVVVAAGGGAPRTVPWTLLKAARYLQPCIAWSFRQA